MTVPMHRRGAIAMGVLLAANSVAAKVATSDAAPAPDATEAAEQDIVVTGSRIARAGARRYCRLPPAASRA